MHEYISRGKNDEVFLIVRVYSDELFISMREKWRTLASCLERRERKRNILGISHYL